MTTSPAATSEVSVTFPSDATAVRISGTRGLRGDFFEHGRHFHFRRFWHGEWVFLNDWNGCTAWAWINVAPGVWAWRPIDVCIG